MSEETIHESEGSRTRQALATYFSRIAKAFRRGEPAPVDDAGTVTVDPGAESEFEVEVEREDGTVSLELELEFDEEAGAVDTDAAASKATFQLYEDAEEKWRWRLLHYNGNIISDWSEGYTDKLDAQNGLDSVKSNAPGAHVVDTEKGEEAPDEGGSDATFELFKDAEGKWRWRLLHDNGNIIADGGQGYASKRNATGGLKSVKSNAPGALVEETES